MHEPSGAVLCATPCDTTTPRRGRTRVRLVQYSLSTPCVPREYPLRPHQTNHALVCARLRCSANRGPVHAARTAGGTAATTRRGCDRPTREYCKVPICLDTPQDVFRSAPTLPCSACRVARVRPLEPRPSVAGARQVARYGVSTLEYLGVPLRHCTPAQYPYAAVHARPPSASAAVRRCRAPRGIIRVYFGACVYIPICICARIYIKAICFVIVHAARKHRPVHTHAHIGGGAPAVAAAHSSSAE
jgi:hypothetical protein